MARSYEDNKIIKSFETQFPKGQPLNKEEFFKWAEQFYSDMSEVDYTIDNWKYIVSGETEN